MHPSSTTPCHTAVHNQSICGISRLTCFSFIVLVTFIVCITQEFTFILNYTTYATTSGSLQDFLFRRVILSRKQATNFNDWRKVTDNIYIYSAYWDNRLNNDTFIRIIGAAKISNSNLTALKCLIKYHYSSAIVEVISNHEILIEHHNKPCRAVYIKCSLNADEFPIFVAVVPMEWNETWADELSWMKVHDIRNDLLLPKISLCVRPLFNYSDVFRISEFIAYYEALGVSHFSFYDYDASDEIIRYLKTLRKENYSIDILPWSLPASLGTIMSVGQMASINDCIYRNMKEIMYVVIVDLDEFITPRHVMTLPELLKLQDVPYKNAASFVLRTSLFCEEYQQDILPSVILPFKTQSSIHREKYIYPFLVRSKYIVKPYMTEVAGVHHVWRFISGWEERFVPASQALVHHYRAELCLNRSKTLEKGEIDVTSRKYLGYLMRSKAVDIFKKHVNNNSSYH